MRGGSSLSRIVTTAEGNYHIPHVVKKIRGQTEFGNRPEFSDERESGCGQTGPDDDEDERCFLHCCHTFSVQETIDPSL